jgi:hypothetical protein
VGDFWTPSEWERYLRAEIAGMHGCLKLATRDRLDISNPQHAPYSPCSPHLELGICLRALRWTPTREMRIPMITRSHRAHGSDSSPPVQMHSSVENFAMPNPPRKP